MYRRPIATALTILFAASVVPLDASTADAQGLLRRIRGRIQSRLAVPPATPPAEANQADDDRSDDSTKPKRVQPIRPADSATSPKKGGRSDSAKGGYGNSILAPAGPAKDQDPRETGPAKLQDFQDPGRPTLGIEVYESSGRIAGLEVVKFREESLADEAGLRLGDLIVEVDGKPTPTTAAITDQLTGKRFGQKINARVVRGNTSRNVLIPIVSYSNAVAKPAVPGAGKEVATRPAAQVNSAEKIAAEFGLEFERASDVRGAVIKAVRPKSPAADTRLKAGDRIVAINGMLVDNRQTMIDELSRRTSNEEISLRLVRDGRLVTADLPPIGNLNNSVTDQPSADPEAGDRSTLQGIGSAIGGLFGGGNANSAKKSEKDEMALEDEEPIRQVGFEERIKIVNPFDRVREDVETKLEDDPPSLESLELPPGKAEPIERDLTDEKNDDGVAEKLREEIKQLEQRLKELETKQAEKNKKD